MKSRLHSLIVFICVAAISLSAGPKSGKSLAEIYKSGAVRFIQEMKIDEASMLKDTYFEGFVQVECDKEGCVYVCDFRANNIKKFDASGKYIKTIGRQHLSLHPQTE